MRRLPSTELPPGDETFDSRFARALPHSLAEVTFLDEVSQLQLDQWRSDVARTLGVADALILLKKGKDRGALQIATDPIGIQRPPNCTPDHGKLTVAGYESAQDLLASPPSLRKHQESVFRQRDDYWTIQYQGHTAFLKGTRGLQCLALLLRHPDREFHVTELVANLLDAPVRAPAVPADRRQRVAANQPVTAEHSSGCPVLDGQSKWEYKRRLNELREDLNEAEECNDPDRAAKIQEETDRIIRHLAAAVGLGGRDRKTSSDAERARSAVTKRIKNADSTNRQRDPLVGASPLGPDQDRLFLLLYPSPMAADKVGNGLESTQVERGRSVEKG